MGKLHKERVVIEKNFQALPTQTDTTVPKISIPKTFRKVTADNFPQWVFSGAKVAELRHTQSGPDPARHPVLDVSYPESPFRARMS